MRKKYSLVIHAQRGRSEERYEFLADDPGSAFGWAERNAAGRELEIFEDGRSLGVATLARGGNLWVLSPASGRSFADQAPAMRHGLRPLSG